MRETWFWSLGQEDALEKEMATHSSILAWAIPWTEEPGRLKFMGLQRVGHNWATNTLTSQATLGGYSWGVVYHHWLSQHTWRKWALFEVTSISLPSRMDLQPPRDQSPLIPVTLSLAPVCLPPGACLLSSKLLFLIITPAPGKHDSSKNWAQKVRCPFSVIHGTWCSCPWWVPWWWASVWAPQSAQPRD